MSDGSRDDSTGLWGDDPGLWGDVPQAVRAIPEASPEPSAPPDLIAATPDQGVWADVVGQPRAVAVLRRAVAASRQLGPSEAPLDDEHAMTHAWLLTGPPGSGRSVAARAFAAALECPAGGCGRCNTCRTALSGAHPDVTLCRTEQLSIGVDEVRELTRKGALAPIAGPWQVLVIEDADRLTDRAAGTLLKSLEEPSRHTIWVLCCPSADDLMATIRSRTREVRLTTPSDDAVIEVLTRRDGIPATTARVAARAAQGHIGRARALATDPDLWSARERIVDLPGTWTSLGACLISAGEVVAQAQAEAASLTSALDAKERAQLEAALGLTGKGPRPRNASAALTQLDDQQKARAKRLGRDALDRVLTELATWYRDVLSLQLHACEAELINTARADRARVAAANSSPERLIACLDAILRARRALDGNVSPLLAMEALFVSLGGY